VDDVICVSLPERRRPRWVVLDRDDELGWQVGDIVATAREFAACGVTFAIHPGLEQDVRGIGSAPGGARRSRGSTIRRETRSA
jgi:hypothetical protein